MTTPMPMRGDRAAPVFDESQPRSLSRYFEDLEVLFTRSAITDVGDRKRYARMYVPMQVAEMWEMLSEYSDPQKSFNDFRDAVLKLYPDTDSDRRFTRDDLHNLVLGAFRNGISSRSDWSSFYRQYYTISTYLIQRNRFSIDEQGRKIFDALPTSLRSLVNNRLQIKQPDHKPDDAYAVADVNDAVMWVLGGSGGGGAVLPPSFAAPSAMPPPPPAPVAAPVASAPQASDGVTIKPEDMRSMIDSLAKLASLVSQGQSAPRSTVSAPQVSQALRAPPPTNGVPRSYGPPTGECHYCGTVGHTITNCPAVAEDLAAGRIVRNDEGRVVLPNGTFVPRVMAGNNMRERVATWHKTYPGHLAANLLSSNARGDLYDPYDPAYDGYSAYYDADVATLLLGNVNTSSAYSLDAEARIQAIVRELNELRRNRGKVFDGVEVPPPPHKRRDPEMAPTREDAPPAIPGDPVRGAHHIPPMPVPIIPAKVPDKPNEHDVSPLHPFDHARDASYIPTAPRAYAQLPRQAAARVRAPIESDKLTDAVFNRLFQRCSVLVTPEELLAIAPDIRAKARVAVTPKRPEGVANAAPNAALEQEIAPDPFDRSIPSAEAIRVEYEEGRRGLAELPYEAYINEFADGARENLQVATESEQLRTVISTINNRVEVECILDPGCQIVAMSEKVALKSGVSWDPRVILSMQSANGQVNPSLGLAKNVPFQFAGITIYLQVHVIRQAAYDVLLGRPFDDITRSIVTNLGGHNHTITLHCPNSKVVATIPTFPRGESQPRTRESGF